MTRFIWVPFGLAEYNTSKTLALRLFLAIWFLMSVILINSYTGNLTSYLTFPALESIPNSFQDLANRKDLSIIVEDKSVLAEQILVDHDSRDTHTFIKMNRIVLSFHIFSKQPRAHLKYLAILYATTHPTCSEPFWKVKLSCVRAEQLIPE